MEDNRKQLDKAELLTFLGLPFTVKPLTTSANYIFICYDPAREDNVSSPVCLSVSQFRGNLCDHYLDMFKLVHLGDPLCPHGNRAIQRPPSPDIFKLVYRDPAPGLAVGGWSSIERASCVISCIE